MDAHSNISRQRAGACPELVEWALLLGVALLAGCAPVPGLRDATVASYHPANVHWAESHLPAQIKRVALLPLTSLTDATTLEFGRDTLGPVLAEELGRSQQFELVVVSSEELRLLTGRSVWTAEERLPLDFFEQLREKLGADAVLFARLTQYRAYEPMSIGWRLKLIETDEPRILWAVDEIFDARVPAVAAAARRFARAHPDSSSSPADGQDALNSPLRFGQYTAQAVVATLPPRQKPKP